MGKGGKKKAKASAKSEARKLKKKKHLRARIGELEAALDAALRPAAPEVSPLARPLPDLPALEGVRLATAKAGVKHKKRTDVMLAELPADTSIAGVFTRSATPLGRRPRLPGQAQGPRGLGAAGPSW